MNINLKPWEIENFYQLYDKIITNGKGDKDEIETFQALIQKIDTEINFFNDDFKLTHSINSEHADAGVDGSLLNLTPFAAEKAKTALDEAIKSGEIKTKLSNEEIKEELERLNVKDLGNSWYFINLNEIILKSFYNQNSKLQNSESKSQVDFSVDLHKPSDSEFLQSFDECFNDICHSIQNNSRVLELTKIDDWSIKEREEWEEILNKTISSEMSKHEIFKLRTTSNEEYNLNLISLNDNFLCFHKHVVKGLLAQEIENLALGEFQEDYYKSPTTYYKFSNEYTSEGKYEYGGNHAAIISSKTGNVFNYSTYFKTEGNLLDFVEGYPLVSENWKYYMSPRENEFKVDEKGKYFTKDDTQTSINIFSDYKSDRIGFIDKINNKYEENQKVRETRLDKIIEDITRNEFKNGTFLNTEFVSTDEIGFLLKTAGEELLANHVEIINPDGNGNDEIKIDGKSYKNLTFDEDVLSKKYQVEKEL